LDNALINVNTIRNMEARGAEPITSSAVTVRKVHLALEALGIEILNHVRPGVRLSIQKKALQKNGTQTPVEKRKDRATRRRRRLRRASS
jgi:hypothetical protein